MLITHKNTFTTSKFVFEQELGTQPSKWTHKISHRNLWTSCHTNTTSKSTPKEPWISHLLQICVGQLIPLGLWGDLPGQYRWHYDTARQSHLSFLSLFHFCHSISDFPFLFTPHLLSLSSYFCFLFPYFFVHPLLIFSNTSSVSLPLKKNYSLFFCRPSHPLLMVSRVCLYVSFPSHSAFPTGGVIHFQVFKCHLYVNGFKSSLSLTEILFHVPGTSTIF